MGPIFETLCLGYRDFIETDVTASYFSNFIAFFGILVQT